MLESDATLVQDPRQGDLPAGAMGRGYVNCAGPNALEFTDQPHPDLSDSQLSSIESCSCKPGYKIDPHKVDGYSDSNQQLLNDDRVFIGCNTCTTEDPKNNFKTWVDRVYGGKVVWKDYDLGDKDVCWDLDEKNLYRHKQIDEAQEKFAELGITMNRGWANELAITTHKPAASTGFHGGDGTSPWDDGH